MRNRRRRLTPLAVIVELHEVFLSFAYMCACGVVFLYLCTCVFPLSARCPSTRSPLHSPSLFIYLSLISSRHFSTHTYEVTCDRFLISRRMRFTLIPAGSTSNLSQEKRSPQAMGFCVFMATSDGYKP